MSNEQEQVRALATQYSEYVVKELAPEEVQFVSAWVDSYLNSEMNLEQALERGNANDNFLGFGSAELQTAYIAPIVVEIVKSILTRIPFLPPATGSKKPERKPGSPDLEFELNKEKDRINLSIKVKGKNKKEVQRMVEKIISLLLKAMNE